MVEGAIYLKGNTIHAKSPLWGTLRSLECLKKERHYGSRVSSGVI